MIQNIVRRWSGAMGIASFLLFSANASAQNDDALKLVYVTHASASNAFFQAVRRGMQDACAQVKAQCQMIFSQTEGSVAEQASNLQAALAGKPDAIASSIVDDKAIGSILKQAAKNGVTVIGVTVDSNAPDKNSVREAYIGQNFDVAGYALAKQLSTDFPKSGPINVLIGVSAPGQNWSEERAAGIVRYLVAYKTSNPNREITWKRIDSGTDLAVTAERVGAYLNANTNVTAYVDTGYWDAGVAKSLKDRGIPPGKILLAGFDIVPDALNGMKSGYIQVHVDQQPYLQGYMPVIEASLIKKLKLSAFDVNTGDGLVLPNQAGNVLALSMKGYR
ncbi:sugar ABC transporter substrate-binding protein [Paraburkholderia youngii]|uniref:sugar ABC transporter substrate-binding protein n=1 Tax=Paraburkholderia youngii TaxID=2782701 RepID=UPI003D252DFF